MPPPSRRQLQSSEPPLSESYAPPPADEQEPEAPSELEDRADRRSDQSTATDPDLQ
jgi:hypothetical protein